MSAEYFLFTEMNINNQWHCINPLVMVIPDSYKQTDKDYDISYTYYSGSRSGFGRTADMLQSIGTSFRVADLSPELQERFKDGYVRQVIVNCTDMTDMIPNAVKYQYHGFMHKDDVFRFETEYEVWGYDYITKAEYLALPNELKAFYQYYEWDDPDDWFYHFKQIINNVQAQVDFFCGINNLCSESCEKRIVMFEV